MGQKPKDRYPGRRCRKRYLHNRFSQNITQVHFIKLRLFDTKGKEVANTFYWRSNDKYEGRKTLTGPTSSGFEDLSKLKQVQLKTRYQTYQEGDRHFIKAEIKNPSSTVAFFTQLQLLGQDKSRCAPVSTQTTSSRSYREKVKPSS